MGTVPSHDRPSRNTRRIQRVLEPGVEQTRTYADYDEDFYNIEFADRIIRHEFIRKVYCILLVQLVFTVGMILFFKLYRPICIFVLTTPPFWWCCLGLSIFFVLILVCCSTLRHKYPINLILLGSFTVIEGIILGGVTCLMKNDIILMAGVITIIVTFALSLFAFQTKCDFTMCGGGLLVVTIVLIILGIVAIFIRDRILHLVYASIGVVIFSMYIIFDTQLMMGGKHKYAIDPDEYILAALHLYLDIILLFLFILDIFSLNN